MSPEWQALASKEAHVLKDPPEHSAFCCSCSLLSLSPTSPICSLEATTSLWQRLAQVCAECFSRILPVGISSGDKCWVVLCASQKRLWSHTGDRKQHQQNDRSAPNRISHTYQRSFLSHGSKHTDRECALLGGMKLVVVSELSHPREITLN